MERREERWRRERPIEGRNEWQGHGNEDRKVGLKEEEKKNEAERE